MDLVDVPLIETWKAMEALVKKGKLKTIGVSNFSEAKIEEIWDAAEIKPAVNQVELHPYFAQPGLVKYCQSKVREKKKKRRRGALNRWDVLFADCCPRASSYRLTVPWGTTSTICPSKHLHFCQSIQTSSANR